MKYAQLLKAIDATSQHLVGRAAAAVNQALVIRNWLTGGYIVEYEQHGNDRAKYGIRLLETLASDLAARQLKGMGVSILERSRRFYLLYPEFKSAIPRSVLADLANEPIVGVFEIPYTPSTESASAILGSSRKIPDTPHTESGTTAPQPRKGQPPVALSYRRSVPALSPTAMHRLSWSQWSELIRMDDPLRRAFYENECLKGNWSVRQLQRQIGSLLYERTGLSKDKTAVLRRARAQGSPAPITDFIRDPYVLEFTGLADLPAYHESDLEAALLDHLQQFLLELGTGFCFECRQKRITVGTKHDYIDLVFYQRRLRCHVLLDLKVRPFSHGDAGQMNFYLNWWKKNGMERGDKPPVGIILCSDREKTEVEFATAGMDNKLFVSRYLVALPSPKQLQEFIERDREEIEAKMTKGRAS